MDNITQLKKKFYSLQEDEVLCIIDTLLYYVTDIDSDKISAVQASYVYTDTDACNGSLYVDDESNEWNDMIDTLLASVPVRTRHLQLDDHHTIKIPWIGE